MGGRRVIRVVGLLRGRLRRTCLVSPGERMRNSHEPVLRDHSTILAHRSEKCCKNVDCGLPMIIIHHTAGIETPRTPLSSTSRNEPSSSANPSFCKRNNAGA